MRSRVSSRGCSTTPWPRPPWAKPARRPRSHSAGNATRGSRWAPTRRSCARRPERTTMRFIIRDLAAAGVPLLAVDANPRALGLHSRLAAGMVCPDPREDEEAFVVFLEQLGPRLPRRAVLFPTHDQYIWPISRHAKRLEPSYIIPFSRWETMRRLHDKREQLETAQRIGVDTPKTVFVDSDDDLARGADEIGFPAIFKPVESLAFK